MITISVDNKPLFIPADTAIVFEQNNNLLGDDGICADIAWSFELPAEPNQRILGTVQYVYSCDNRRYSCEIAVDGIPISRGELYVQGTKDEKRLTCGFVGNTFGIGFGQKMLRENNYGEDVVISETIGNHQSGWRQFLKGSLADNSVYKFFLFADEKFYGNNEDWGYHSNQLSGLQNNRRADQFHKYVNRLFFSQDLQTIYENSENSMQGVRLFNTAGNGRVNGYAFAPAIKLVWLIGKVFENAQLRPTGSFLSNTDIARLFSQSLCAMDGDGSQYGVNAWLTVNGQVTPGYSTIQNGLSFNSDAATGMFTSFGWGNNVSIGFKLPLDPNDCVHDGTTEEIFALLIGTADAANPSLRMRLSWTESDGTPVFKYGRAMTTTEIKQQIDDDPDDVHLVHAWSVGNGTCNMEYYGTWGALITHKKTVGMIHTTNSTLVQLTSSLGKNVSFPSETEGYLEGSVLQRITNDVSSLRQQFVRLVKCKVKTYRGDIGCPWTLDKMSIGSYGIWETLSDYEYITTAVTDTTGSVLNIFRNVLQWKEHVPDLSNGEFLNTICKAFGVQLYANPMTRTVQLDFFSDMAKGGIIDISEWVTGKERLEYAPKKYKVTLESVRGGSDIADRNILDAVTTAEELPAAGEKRGKHAFVRNENLYRRSEQEEDNGTKRDVWGQAGGNNIPLETGADNAEEEEDVEMKIGVPNMRITDRLMTPKYICEVDKGGCSPLFDEDFDGRFDMVLMQYRGKREVNLDSNGGVASAYIEDANPTHYNANGTTAGCLSLTATGTNSIGEKWLRPVYDLLGNCDRYRLVAHLPSWVFFKVMATLQPQDGTPSQQVRYIQCDGLRILPVKISSELSGRPTVVCTIEGIKPHIEV